MRIFRSCGLVGHAGWIWDEDARIWWSSEWIGRHNAVILYRRDYHAEVAMIAASKVVGTEPELALSVFLIWWSVSYIGSSRILVRTG